jgi:hypothetical protein
MSPTQPATPRKRPGTPAPSCTTGGDAVRWVMVAGSYDYLTNWGEQPSYFDAGGALRFAPLADGNFYNGNYGYQGNFLTVTPSYYGRDYTVIGYHDDTHNGVLNAAGAQRFARSYSWLKPGEQVGEIVDHLENILRRE